jgi:cbb3-type cytochrome oxidase maturation protein
MNMLMILIPVALALGALGLGAFLWSLESGQYDDLEGAAFRILDASADEPEQHSLKEPDRHSHVS